MLYSEKTLRYYENLKNIGELDDTLPNVGTGIVGSPLCGDVMKLQLFFGNDDVILDAKYKVFGCVSAIASMELATTLLKGKNMAEALKITNESVAEELQLSDIKKHCSVLAKEAIEAAINNYLNKKKKDGITMITMTQQAVEKLKEMIGAQNATGILVTVESGGCSGIRYSLSYEMEPDDSKTGITINDIKFYFDTKDEPIIDGLTIDIVDHDFGRGFSVTNNRHSSCQNCTCGCRPR